jgi:phospholipid/cholesterol/gamma-HCH transport system ATP-binding protein
MIEVKNVHKAFGDRMVLNDISFVFETGKTNLVIGESGSGKTTMLKIMVGLHTPDQGDVLYDGRSFTSSSEKEKQEVRKEIGMLFQGGALFDSLTLEQNVAFPLDMFTDMSKSEKEDRVNFCLKKVNLEGRNKLFPSELSGGMKKRAALARAISNEPKYLFCDEPNSGLDPRTSLVIDALIKQVTEDLGMTTVVITHDMNSVMEIGENIMFLYKGNMWWQGSKKEILTTDNQEILDFVYASEFLKQLKPRKQ